jgi:hypothetical protein
MIKRFINWFKINVLNIKPIFKIKIEKSWFSDRYFAIKFSNNNGWSWRYIQDYKYAPLSHCYELECEIAYFNPDGLKDITKKLTSYELCDAYNKKVIDHINNTNTERRKKYFAKVNAGIEFMNEFNKK